jgi:hypothetical protein
MSYYAQFQLNNYGNIIREDGFTKQSKPVANLHTCPLCNWLCSCSSQPCSCCADELEHGNDEAEKFNNWMRNGEESLLREIEMEFPYK